MELFRALAVLAEPPGPGQVRIAATLGLPETPDPAEHLEVFALQLYPYASVYVGAEGMLGGEARDRVAGYWRALGRVPPHEPDHLTVLLALYAVLAEHERDERDHARRLLWAQSRKALLWEHLVSWLFAYLHKLSAIGPPFYRAWGSLLAEALAAEIGAVGPAEILPLHLRRAPPLPDPRTAGADAFLRGLLAPVRSGIVLTRADLARAAHDTGLGMRVGGRRFILQSLLGQEADGTLAWLESEARAWVPAHLACERIAGDVAGFWAERAEATAGLLAALRREPASPRQEYGSAGTDASAITV
jgi:hypothetical protein